ncbi:MAG: aminoacetone oxidase family FAD-binding enzyme [Alphaproteobacteria bacterium]|nr:aminoacetone oxidase family FAD-binding enzyme [Alphaproteobacteria bacterium]
MKTYDVIIIGAGAGGLKAASELHARNKSVLVIDMGNKPARKVAVSGGGKCNFTNMAADFTRYFGNNPHFVKSALAQYSPQDTLNWIKKHKIKYYEKEPGRFFCVNGANDIANALMKDIGNTEIKYNTTVNDVIRSGDAFLIKTDNGDFKSNGIIVASGGVSYPNLGVSNIGHIIAKKFGHKIGPIRPALCAIKTKCFDSELAGISLPVEIKIGKNIIRDDLLFTHFGIGGPAVYRATLFDRHDFIINFAPNTDIENVLLNAKRNNGKRNLTNVMADILPQKLARFICKNDTRNIADYTDLQIKEIAKRITQFEINDAKSIGLQSAEVTAGGVSVDKISSKTMESLLCPNLFFVGEVMDITGDLGGFNLQWAFSSGFVAGNNA